MNFTLVDNTLNIIHFLHKATNVFNFLITLKCIISLLQNDKTLFNGKIDSIQDIEENIWVPKLGVKGKIDVSVKVRPRNNFFDGNN